MIEARFYLTYGPWVVGQELSLERETEENQQSLYYCALGIGPLNK